MMAKTTDWLPGTRDAQQALARNWTEYLTLARRTAWGVPQEQYNELVNLFDKARSLLAQAMDEAVRTHVVTVECQAAFKALTSKLRFFKDRFYRVPPLTEGDWAALGLRPKDTTPTPSGAPTAQVTIETYLVGRHEIGIKIVYVTGNPDDRANKGYRIWYSVAAPGETPPANPEDLHKSFYTKRKKDLIEFGFGDSGKTAWFAVQVENDGKKGPWGPLVSALIP
jgi:hypothetical protein